MKRLRAVVLLGTVGSLALAGLGEDGALVRRPMAAATTQAATGPTSRPATRPVHRDVAVARQMIDAGDPRIIPTLMEWLASEQDVPMVGSGSARLLEAMRGVHELRVKEAVPWLINVTGTELLQERAGSMAIMIDPSYSPDFVREQFERGRFGRITRATPIVAAAALAETAQDGAARDFLLAGYRAVLDEKMTDRNVARVFIDHLRRSADPSLRERVVALAANYSQPGPRTAAERVAEQMRLNRLTAEELTAICEDETKEEMARQMAMLALAWRGTPDVLPRLDKLDPPRMVATSGADAVGENVITPAVSAAAIRRRYRLGKASVAPPRATVPAVAEAEVGPVIAAGEAEGIVMHCTGVSVDPNVREPTPYVGLIAFDGSTPLLRVQAANDEILKVSRSLDYDGLVVARLSPDQKKVLSLRPIDPRPGELTRDGYVLVERCKVTDGATERSAVRLSKLGRQFLARIPNRTGANGAIVSDSALTRAVEQLTPGEGVEARFEEGGRLTMLSAITAYRPAVRAVYVRRVELRREGEPAPGIEVKLGGRDRTFVLPAQGGPRRPTLDEKMIEALMPGCELKLTVEGDPMAEGEVRPVLRDLRIDGTLSWRPGRSGLSVRARRASWTSGGSMSWNWLDGEFAALRTALARVNADKTNALAFAPDTVAALREAFGLLEKLDFDAVRKELTPLAEAMRQEGNRDRQEALEQRMFLGLQRFIVGFDTKSKEQMARVKRVLNEEQYKALLAFGAGGK